MRGRWALELVVTGIAVTVALSACASTGGGPPTATTATPAPSSAAAAVLGPFYGAGGTHAQAALALTIGCAALSPADRNHDSYSFNGEISTLLSGWGPAFAGDGAVRRDARSLDEALIGACSAHPSEPEQFLDQVSATLSLSGSDLTTAIGDACARYETRVRNGVDDPDAADAYDRVPPAIVTLLGEDLSPRRLVEAYCGPGATDAPSTSPG